MWHLLFSPCEVRRFWLQGTRFLDLKGKCAFGKHHVTKRNLGFCPLLLGFDWRGYQQVSSLTGNQLEKLQNKTEQIFLPFQHKCITGELFSWIFWLWEFDLRKKEEELWSYTFKMSSTDLPQTSSGFLWRKEYPTIHRKTMNIMLQFLTSHIFKQPFSYSMDISSKLRNGLTSIEKEICVCQLI